jgi:Asp-tRNA(Asn)/Glu-tRNA(Gln) amidotransferase A subunit family amidase
VGLAKQLRAGEASVTELVRELLVRLDRLAPSIGAVAATDPERSMAEAGAELPGRTRIAAGLNENGPPA